MALREKTRWVMPQKIPPGVDGELSSFTPVERQILFMRGLSTRTDVDRFLGRNEGDDHDPFLMRDMDVAIKRIEAALRDDERIVVYGDYDADGVTGTVLLTEVLRAIGGDVKHYIPDRFSEGYGLNTGAISKIAAMGTRLIVCVDCGVRDIEQIQMASEEGVDVIVIDHHEPGSELPAAAAIINPKQEGDQYPFKSLSGVGLAYKVAQALSVELRDLSTKEYLDLVALGTVADIVRLRGENRLLASEGIEKLNAAVRPGLKEIMRLAKLRPGGVTATTIGFVIGPRLNAAGRLGSAERAVKLLATQDESEAKLIAGELDRVNRKRQTLTEKAVDDAKEQIDTLEVLPDVILVAQQNFNEGIVGLIASRVKDQYYRPTFIGTRGEEITRGSARSIPGFNIARALEGCRDILLKYGGHEKAGGFTLKTTNLNQFEKRLGEIAEEQLSESDFVPEIEIDAEVEIADLNDRMLKFFDRLEPCGEGNPAPVLMTEKVFVAAKRAVGMDGKHLKLTVRKGGSVMDAIAFRKGHLMSELPEKVDVAYRLERNEYMGVTSLQMNVVDIRW
jgi:single-stranded-DNA-specific exonuclease